MPKQVDLIDLKKDFRIFLIEYYCCQNCKSIDILAFGFNCEHKFCKKCNDNNTDQCKVCKTNIEKVHEDNGVKKFLNENFSQIFR